MCKIENKNHYFLINYYNNIVPGTSGPSFALETGDVDPCKCGVNDID